MQQPLGIVKLQVFCISYKYLGLVFKSKSNFDKYAKNVLTGLNKTIIFFKDFILYFRSHILPLFKKHSPIQINAATKVTCRLVFHLEKGMLTCTLRVLPKHNLT